MGLNLIAGLALQQLFAEAKIQLVPDRDTNAVVSVGVTLPLL